MRWKFHLLVGAVLAVSLVAGCARKTTVAGGVIVFLGDSITAGYGLDLSQAYPSLIHFPGMSVVNLGVSGSKSEDGLQRLKDYFASGADPRLVVIELGANDFLQGVPHAVTGENIAAAIRECQSRHIPVMLCGIRIPGKFGTDEVFSRAAGDAHVPLLPDILEGLQARDGLLQDDGHPTAEGQKIIAAAMQAALRKSFAFDAR